MGKRKNPLANVVGVAVGTPVMKMIDPKVLKMNLETNRQSGFDKESIESLAGSLKDQGMLEPVIVQEKSNGELWVVDGHRRTTAALTLEGFLVPAIVKPELTDEQEFIIKITANEHREDASPIDRANAMIYAKEMLKWNQNKIAEIFDCYPADVSRDLSLLRLPKKIQNQVHKGKMTMKDALKLVPLSEKEKDDIAEQTDKKIKEMEEEGATDPEIRRNLSKQLDEKIPGKKPKSKTKNGSNTTSLDDLSKEDQKADDDFHGDVPSTNKPSTNKPSRVKDDSKEEEKAKEEVSKRLAGLGRLLSIFATLENEQPDSFAGKIATIMIDLYDEVIINNEAMEKIAELG